MTLSLTLGPATTEPQARANRLAIEAALAAGPCVLPAGEILIDRNVPLKSGHTLRGAGMTQTRLRNAFGTAVGINSTVVVQNDPNCGYADSIINGKLVDSAAAKNYPVGGSCFSYFFDGYLPENGSKQHVTQHTVAGAGPKLKPAPHPKANTLVWLVPSKGEGWARITPGPVVANELFGETRFLRNGWFDRPLQRGYINPTIAAITPTEGVTIEDLTLCQPAHPNASPFFAAWTAGLRMNRVRIEGFTSMALSTDMRWQGVEVTGRLEPNAIEDSVFRGLTCKALYLEEGALDLTFTDLLVRGSEENGIYSTTRCSNLRFDRFRVEGVGITPIAVSGPGMSFANGVLTGNSQRPDNMSWMSGDDLIVRDVVSDTRLSLGGRRIQAERVTAPTTFPGWVGAPADGQFKDVANLDWQYTPQGEAT